jgi:hypothetical protein
MEKTSLAFSHTFSATYGNYKFFEFLDEHMASLPEKDIDEARSICAHMSTMCAQMKDIKKVRLLRWCAQHLRKDMLAEAEQIEHPQIRSRIKNFISAKYRDLMRSLD